MPSGITIVSVPLSVALYNADGSFRTPFFLVTLDVPDYGEIHLGSPYYTGPDDVPWDEGIDVVGVMDAGGSPGTNKWNPADLNLVIQDKRITDQGVSETFLDFFPDYEFVGTSVHVQVAFSNTVSTTDYRTIFKGRVEDWRDMTATGVTLYCVQDREWAKPIPPNILTRDDFEYAPADSIGVPRPILIGDWSTGINTLTGTMGVANKAWLAGVFRGGFPTLMVELESAAGTLESPKVMASDKDMGTDPAGLLIYEPTLDAMCHSYSAVNVTGSGPVYAQLADYQFRGVIVPTEILTSTTTSTDAQELIRKDKPYTLEGRATLDFDANKKIIELLLPDIQPLGSFVSAFAYIWYNKPLTGGSHPQWGVKNSHTTNTLVAFGSGASSGFPGDVPTDSDDLDVSASVTGWDQIKNTTLYAEVRNGGEELDIHRFVLTVIYKPPGRVVTPGIDRPGEVVARYNARGQRIEGDGNGAVLFNQLGPSRSTPDVLSFSNSLYSYGTGVVDSGHASGTGSGTYTGSAGALIEHPCDIAHWALRELGGLNGGEISTGSSFGSFETARTTLADYAFRLQLAELTDVEAFVEELGRQSLCWFHRRTTDPAAPFVAIPWGVGSTQDYREPGDLVTFNAAQAFVERGSLRAGRTAISAVANEVRVNFDFDPRTRSWGEQVYITDTNSRGWTGSAFAQDESGGREDDAADSVALFGRKAITFNLPWVKDPATATDIRNRLFDWRVNPRVLVSFNTFLNAIDLERGHVIQMGNDWDSYLPYPKPGSNASWGSKNLQVFSVTKSAELPIRYTVKAIEV